MYNNETYEEEIDPIDYIDIEELRRLDDLYSEEELCYDLYDLYMLNKNEFK